MSSVCIAAFLINPERGRHWNCEGAVGRLLYTRLAARDGRGAGVTLQQLGSAGGTLHRRNRETQRKRELRRTRRPGSPDLQQEEKDETRQVQLVDIHKEATLLSLWLVFVYSHLYFQPKCQNFLITFDGVLPILINYVLLSVKMQMSIN